MAQYRRSRRKGVPLHRVSRYAGRDIKMREAAARKKLTDPSLHYSVYGRWMKQAQAASDAGHSVA
jgi:hypothetical protein